VDPATLLAIVYSAVPFLFLVLVVAARRAKRHGSSLRAGVVGAMYEWQHREKQRALDVIVEGKAAQRDAEHPDGDLPQLASRGKKPPN
jgi:hypothetical protein